MLRGPYNIITDEKRAIIVESYLNNDDYIDIARRLHVNENTAYSIVRKFVITGRADAKSRGGNVYNKVDDEMKDCLQMLLEENSGATVKRLNEFLRITLPNKPHVCNRTIASALDGMLYTLKELRPVICNRNREDVKEERQAHATWLMNQGIQQHLVFIDEAGYNVYTQRRYGRSVVGTRCHRVIAGQRGKNVTLVAAMSVRHGVLYSEFIRGGMTADKYNDFLTSLSSILGDEAAVLVMDNARPHAQAAVDCTHHVVRFLPAYSPFLNPIENMFSKFKQALKERLAEDQQRVIMYDRAAARRLCVTMEEFRARFLIEHGVAALQTITADDCAHWHHLTFSYLQRCLGKEDIFVE